MALINADFLKIKAQVVGSEKLGVC